MRNSTHTIFEKNKLYRTINLAICYVFGCREFVLLKIDVRCPINFTAKPFDEAQRSKQRKKYWKLWQTKWMNQLLGSKRRRRSRDKQTESSLCKRTDRLQLWPNRKPRNWSAIDYDSKRRNGKQQSQKKTPKLTIESQNVQYLLSANEWRQTHERERGVRAKSEEKNELKRTKRKNSNEI